MDKNDKDLEVALDDIFGSDFIEIDVNQSKNTIEAQNDVSKLDMGETVNDKPIIFVDEEKKTTNSIAKEKETFKDVLTNQFAETQVNFKDCKSTDINKKIDDINNNSKKKGLKIKNKKIFIWFIICFILILLTIFILINYVFGITKVVNCSSSAEDEGYKYTEEYKITYKKNSISYIESTYTYNALNDEFKSQIDYIKQDRLLYIVNSNGMPGFTYLYEISDDYIKVEGYLDFNLIEFDKVDKINQEQMPISSIEINSKTSFKTLKKNLEGDGYICVSSK